MDDFKLFHCDCLEGFKQLADESVDLVLMYSVFPSKLILTSPFNISYD